MLTNEIPLPTNEAGRLAILRHYQILDTEPEPAFDDLARLAAFCCQTPIALINFVDQQRVWSKALVNFPYPELPRELSACTYAILQNDLCIVPDALLDARFTTNPLVTAPAGLRFYAGVPLYTPEGYAIGTLCVMDLTPRQLTAEQQDALRALARQVTTHLALRRSMAEMQGEQLERQQATQALTESENRFRTLFEASPIGICISRPNVIFYANPTARTMFGYADLPEGTTKSILDFIAPESQPLQIERIKIRTEGQAVPPSYEAIGQRQDGSHFPIHIETSDVELTDGPAVVAFITDTTEYKRLEEQLRHSQKMEAIGRLAGGIAHDFNNILMAIYGSCALALLRLGQDDPVRRYVSEIQKAGERAVALTHQLLAFSRKQIIQTKVLALNDMLMGMEEILRRLVGEHIHFTLLPAPRLGAVRVDPGQMEQVILNLVANARDAMPNGGQLTISTQNANLPGPQANLENSTEPLPYILLTVQDSGHGMDQATLAHIFEPFFTTKAYGKGTGLGLATVYSIVQQSGGEIRVVSQVERGTTVQIFLPQVAEEPQARELINQADQLPLGTEHVLLVEDEEMVRRSTREMLETRGYQVIEAASPMDALRIVEAQQFPIHILLTDVVMPLMSGRELADRLFQSQPQIKVLFMSGHTDDAVVTHGVRNDRMAFLQKPFTLATLLHKIRTVLDE